MAPGAPTAEGAAIVDPEHFNPRPRTSALARASHHHQVDSRRYVGAVLRLMRWVNVAMECPVAELVMMMRLQHPCDA
eukprot:6208048-Pleurochrysis_carterae.AAC.1